MCISTLLTIALIVNTTSISAAEVTPDQLEFHRQRRLMAKCAKDC